LRAYPKTILCINYKFRVISFHKIDDIPWKSIEPYLPRQKNKDYDMKKTDFSHCFNDAKDIPAKKEKRPL